VVEGSNAIIKVRNMIGATSPQNALPGTIRGDYGLDVTRNVVHASDSAENSEREINLFFKDHELISY
jgi:nucleoside-diphosphate kinase